MCWVIVVNEGGCGFVGFVCPGMDLWKAGLRRSADRSCDERAAQMSACLIRSHAWLAVVELDFAGWVVVPESVVEGRGMTGIAVSEGKLGYVLLVGCHVVVFH